MVQLRPGRPGARERAAPFTNILISVDGDRDTPEAMARFLAQFSPGFIGLTGDPETVARGH